ncbi:MAG: TIM barrel protein [Patescibacteria group bacterium]|nr:TIM barrel protein [Patescibacteria group bacterium]
MFGPHINRKYSSKKGATMTDQVRAAVGIATNEGFDVKAASVFVSNPRGWKMTMTNDEAAELKEYLEETKMCVIAHGSYLDVALFSKDKRVPAGRFIREEVKMCAAAGIRGLVVHLPNKGVDDVVASIPSVFTLDKTVLVYLETPAVSPSKSHYETPEKLATLFAAIRKKVDPKLMKIGLCIDTAHIWTCGVDISSYEKAEAWLDELRKYEDVIPPSHIMFHLNDSVYECGDGKDEHATLLRGKIWGAYEENPEESGLAAFLRYAMGNNTPCILERKPESEIPTDYRTILSMTTAPSSG